MAPGFVDKVDAVRAKVAKAFEVKTISAVEAKLTTGTQNSAARVLKVWGRGAVARAHAAIRMGVLIPDEMTARSMRERCRRRSCRRSVCSACSASTRRRWTRSAVRRSR
jgi:hypothetical protein